MSLQNPQLERRRLNEEIELAFIAAAKMAANCEMKIISGKGSVFADFQDFYNNFNYLIRLTMRLGEMEPKQDRKDLDTLKEDIRSWMSTDVTKNIDLIEHCKNGLKLFDDYYHELMHCGIIALPTKKG